MSEAQLQEALRSLEAQVLMVEKLAAAKATAPRAVSPTQKIYNELVAEIAQLKKDLDAAELAHGFGASPSHAIPKGYIPSQVLASDSPAAHAKATATAAAATTAPTSATTTASTTVNPAKAKKEEKPKPAAAAAATPALEAEPDVSRLDLRVGRIITAKKHPDADSLYVEEIDVGEATPRQVVSGLVKWVPEDQMQNRMVVVLCNLKPAKMRGVLSHAMVMCASCPEKVELLDVPTAAKVGDRVICDGFEGQTPDAELSQKKKTWEAIAPHLHTDTNRVACYKNIPFSVAGQRVLAPTLANTLVK